MPERIESLSYPALVQATETTYQTANAYLGRLFAARFYHELEATWFVTDGIAFNKVLSTPFTTGTPKSTINEILKRIAVSSAGSMSWDIGPSLRGANVADCLHENGWFQDEAIRSMVLDLHALKTPADSPTGLTIELVKDEETFKHFIDTTIAGFAFPEPVARHLSNIEHGRTFLNDPATRYYLGRFQGEPVTVSVLLLCEGIAGIYNVATIPQMRCRGFGTAMTLVALREALALDYYIAVLQASEMGVQLYRDLGFQDHFTFDSYHLQREAEI